MANVGFPQKSTFGVITATEVRTPLVNNPAGSLSLKVAGVTKQYMTGTVNQMNQHVKLQPDVEVRDSSDAVIIASDNAGSIDQLAPITDALGVRTPVVTADGAIIDGVDITTLDDHLALEAANATWINCPYEGAEFVEGDKMNFDGSMTAYHIVGAGRYVYSVPLPTTRGGKALYINGTRISLSAADGSNRVYESNLYGMGDTTGTELDSDPTDKNTVALHEDVSLGNIDVSGYDSAKVVLKTAVATEANLKVQYVTVRYYYA